MISEVAYHTAAQRSPVPVGKRGLYANETVRILESVSGVSWRGPQFAWLRPLDRLPRAKYPFAVVIRHPWKWARLHCVAVYNGKVYDPGHYASCRIGGYGGRKWRVVAVYHPVVPGRLMAVRIFHRRERFGLPAALYSRAACDL